VASWLSAVVFIGVAVLSFVMSAKGLTASRLLPFHQSASGREWASFTADEQAVALALTRSLGLGLLVAGLSLVGAAVAAVLDAMAMASVLAVVACVFCAGLAVINRRLTLATGTSTPWRGSVYAAVLIVLAIVILIAFG
jgi:hypothetical protein